MGHHGGPDRNYEAQLPALSKLGQIWGLNHPQRPKHLEGTGRTGLTPIETTNDPLQQHLQNIEILYQRSRLARFCTRQLLDLGALEDENVVESNLDNCVHPVFSRENWDRQGTLPLPGGREGYWSASNEDVWRALLPSIRLASHILCLADCWEFFDAITSSKVTRMKCPPAAPGAHNLLLMPLNARDKRQTGGALRSEYLGQFSTTEIRFSIGSSYFPPYTESAHGYTLVSDKYNFSQVTMSAEDISPLLEHNYPLGSKLVSRHLIAVTLVHELCHAICGVRFGRASVYWDKLVAEAGSSMENIVFGGVFSALPSKDHAQSKINPYFALLLNRFPSVSDVDHLPLKERLVISGLDRLHGYGDEFYTDYWPVPLKWISDMQQEGYWRQHVARFQGQSLQVYPKLLAHRHWSIRAGYRQWTERSEFAVGGDLQKFDWLQRTREDDPEIFPRRRWAASRLNNKRVTHARKLASRIRGIPFYDDAGIRAGGGPVPGASLPTTQDAAPVDTATLLDIENYY